MEKQGIEPANPGLQGIGLSPTQLWLTKNQSFEFYIVLELILRRTKLIFGQTIVYVRLKINYGRRYIYIRDTYI